MLCLLIFIFHLAEHHNYIFLYIWMCAFLGQYIGNIEKKNIPISLDCTCNLMLDGTCECE